MIYPKFITNNSNIGVCAPSDGISGTERINRLNSAITNFLEHDIKVIESKNVRNSNNGRSCSAKERANELTELVVNNNIDAIICASGGDFMLEILPHFDFTTLVNNPKWVQGYSDPTVITFIATTKYDIASIYSHNFTGFGQKTWHPSIQNNFDLLTGKNIIQYNFKKYEKNSIKYITGTEGYNLDTPVCWKSLNGDDINIKGRLIGGCIDVITEIIGTPYDNIINFIKKYKDDGIIWYFDNAELSCEDIIRTIWKFEACDYFKYSKCILFGRSMNESSIYDISFKETLKTAFKNLNIPVVYGMDFGHIPPRITIINGSYAHIVLKEGRGSISFEYK